MANRRFEQHCYSLVKKIVHIFARATFIKATAATVSIQDLTYTAAAVGTGGNLINITYVDTGTAGSEVVNVTGNDIEIEIEDGVSTATQVKTAFDLSGPATALASVAVTGTGGNAQVEEAQTFLISAVDDEFVVNEGPGVESISVLGTGHYSINLDDSYMAIVGADVSIQKASAADLIAQVVSADVVTNKEVIFKTLATATATKPLTDDVVYIHLTLRNSSQTRS